MLMMLTLLGAGAYSLYRGHAHARIYMAAWATLLVGVLVYSLKNVGYLPINFFTLYAMQISSAIELVLLTFGVAQRLHAAENARHEAQRRALQFELETKAHKAVLQTAQLMAHDVRAPFSLVELAVTRIRSATALADVTRIIDKLLPQLRKAAAGVNGMIADVMELGAPDGSRESVRKEVALDALIDASLSEIFLLYPNATLRFTYDLRHTLAVDGDASRLQRVVSNIVQNAVQAVLPCGHIWFSSR
jgi:signal transduction histidine kinase